MHRALSCVHTHCRSAGWGISESTSKRDCACALPGVWHALTFRDLSHSLTHREYTVWAIGTVPHRRTARFLFTRYQLQDRPRLRIYTLRVRLLATFDPPPLPYHLYTRPTVSFPINTQYIENDVTVFGRPRKVYKSATWIQILFYSWRYNLIS